MVQICAHRGDSGRYRENTLPAIRSAIAAGAEFVEVDAQLTADGAVIVIHDATMQRLWGHPIAVADTTLEEVLSLGTADARPPLLLEVLELFDNVTSTLLIDLSSPALAEPAFHIITRAAASVAWCGDDTGMHAIRLLDPAARIWMAWNHDLAPKASDLARLAPDAINAPFSILSPEIIAAVHTLGRKVTAYTIDDDATLRRACQIGVDVVTTNRLNLAQRIAAEMECDLRRSVEKGVQAKP